MVAVTLLRSYYRSIDEKDYETLTRLLAEGFVHRRPDTQIEGRETFVEWMQYRRPKSDTTHDVVSMYDESGGEKAAVEGTLRHRNGETWFRFVDTFVIGSDGIERVDTYTDLVSKEP